MARINTYESQVATPSGTVYAGKENIAHPQYRLDFESIGQGFANLARASEQSEQNNARAQLASMEPQAQLAMLNEYQRVTASWAPGQKPIAEQMGTFIDNYATGAEKSLNSDFGRNLVRERATEFKTKYMLAGATAQLGIETDVRIGEYAKGYEALSLLSMTQPEALGPELAKLNGTVMADTQIPLTRRQELVRANSSAAAFQVAKVQAESNPQQALATVNKLLGVTEPVLDFKPGSGNMADVTAEIVRRESGGRMFGGDGKTLRGPAITTADGKTIHAYGKYQLLESTAKAAAQAQGVAWQPEVFYRDRTGDAALDAETEAYHDQLGQAYIQAQQAEFGGNPILVAAAHNMGPEATRGWAAGRPYQTQSGKWWYPTKPMDMGAMPTETRKYIQGLGTVTEQPATQGLSVDVQSEGATAYRLLDTEQLLAVRSAAQSSLSAERQQANAQFAVDRDLFKQRVTDMEVAAKNGDPITLPTDQELLTYLGPANGQLTKQRLQGYQTMASSLRSLPGLSNDELLSVANMPDPDGSEDRENRQFVRDTLAAQAQKVLDGRKADPGRAAAESSPQVRSAYGAWQQAATAFYETPEAQRTPEQFAAVNDAQAAYVAASFSQQRQWGVLEPKLPVDVAEKIAAGFQHQLSRGEVASASARLRVLPQQVGGSYEALAQVGEKTGDIGWFAMEGVSDPVLKALQVASTTKPDEQAKLLPGGVKTSDIKQQVTTAFAPLMRTFAAPGVDGAGDNVTANRYYNAGVTLASQYLISGQATSAKDAAAKAYQALYLDREQVSGTLRIPRTYDADKVSNGLGLILREFKPTQMYLEPGFVEPGLTISETRARVLRNVQRNGTWVTSEDGEGAYLMAAGKPVLDGAGKPIRVAYRTAQGVRGQLVNPLDEATLNRQWGIR